ncbi:unnamed protein product [Symbiodinium pilosum]|uniref:Uncharacterized protein n=1 Tax=Symbiodinium pilosum TaxID=2952 RepID=A0A812L6Y9_SYMPI|nr:unnamed protein product [Symbiodinium pilosum]
MPPDSIKVYIKWSEDTAELFEYLKINWSEKELVKIQGPDAPITIDDMSNWIESRVEDMYETANQGMDKIMVQVQWIATASRPKMALKWNDAAHEHFKDEDLVVVGCHAISERWAEKEPGYTKQNLKEIRKTLRFGLSDRVLCNCGGLWLPGSVVGTAVESDGEIFPYVVKTDPIPGMPSRTISVPSDNNKVCVQEAWGG